MVLMVLMRTMMSLNVEPHCSTNLFDFCGSKFSMGRGGQLHSIPVVYLYYSKVIHGGGEKKKKKEKRSSNNQDYIIVAAFIKDRGNLISISVV